MNVEIVVHLGQLGSLIFGQLNGRDVRWAGLVWLLNKHASLPRYREL